MLRPWLTELQVVPGELPLLVVGQLGWVDEGVAVAPVALNDLPAHLVLGLLQREREEAWVSWAWQVDLGHHPDPGGQGLGSPTAQREEVGVACDVVRGCVISCPWHREPRPCLAWPYHGTAHSPSLSFPTCVLKDLDRTTSEGFDSSDKVVIPEPGGRVEL